MIGVWARQNWEEVRGKNTLFPSTGFFPEALQKRLSKKIHVVTSIKQLSSLLHDWHYLNSHGEKLFRFCEEALEGLESLRQEAQDADKMVEDGKKETQVVSPVEDHGQKTQVVSPVKIRIPASKQKIHEVDPVGERPQKRQCR